MVDCKSQITRYFPTRVSPSSLYCIDRHNGLKWHNCSAAILLDTIAWHKWLKAHLLDTLHGCSLLQALLTKCSGLYVRPFATATADLPMPNMWRIPYIYSFDHSSQYIDCVCTCINWFSHAKQLFLYFASDVDLLSRHCAVWYAVYMHMVKDIQCTCIWFQIIVSFCSPFQACITPSQMR